MGLAEQACMQVMGALAGEMAGDDGPGGEMTGDDGPGGEMTGLFAGTHTSTWHPSMYRRPRPWWNQVHTGREWWDQYQTGDVGGPGWKVVEERFVPANVRWELSHSPERRTWSDGVQSHEETMITGLDERRWKRDKTYNPAAGTLVETYSYWGG